MIDLRQGDCLEVIGELADGSVDLVLTDPPYIVGATSVGNPRTKCGTWADMLNASHWFAAWYSEAWRALRETGYFATFCNWRSMPTVMCALAKCGIPATSCLVWNKEWIGPSYKNALRPTYELVILCAKPEAQIVDRGASDLISCKWMAANSGKHGHPAEKPESLCSQIIRWTHPDPGGVILDPFMGSGTTGAAAVALGHNFIGIEADVVYFAIAEKRIKAEMDKHALIDGVA